MNPRLQLEKRYPTADFSLYFWHLAASQTQKNSGMQEHHICPRKQFPEYEFGFPENLVTLSLENHGLAHNLLELACGIKAPSTSWIESQTWTPERLALHAKAAAEAHAVPETKARHKSAMKDAYAKPSVREALSAAMKAALALPEAKSNQSLAQKEAWKTRKPSTKPRKKWSPEARSRQSAALAGNQNARKSA